jgi:dihydrofolate synthase/folylpolyglutamate synthase
MSSYQEALDYIYSFIDQEKLAPDRYVPRRFDLSNTLALLAMVGDPHRRLRAVHVAGTKGKGSTCAMTASILRAAGYRVGLFTQPHLHTFRERIVVNGRLMSEDELVFELEELRPFIGRVPDPSTFEIMTVLAFQYFARQGVDFAVVETGLGGRLDTTNVIDPLVAVITSISYDHMYILGNTLAEIASEKAGIIKQGKPLVCASQRPTAAQVIATVCQEQNAPLIQIGKDWLWEQGQSNLEGQSFTVRSELGDGQSLVPEEGSVNLWIPLLGRYQLTNATASIAAVDQLWRQGVRVTLDQVAEGLRRTHWPARLEILGREPLLVMDGAHNVDSIERLLEALREYLAFDRLIVVVGFSADKDIEGMMGRLAAEAEKVIVAKASHPRAAEPQAILRKVGVTPQPTVVHDVPSALWQALELANGKDLVCVTGSLFVVAEARAAWLKAHNVEFDKDPPL